MRAWGAISWPPSRLCDATGYTKRAMSLFSGLKERLRDGLKRSQEYLSTGLATVLEPDRPIDDTLYEELEELLIAADLGAAIAADFTNRAREEVMFGTVTRADQLRPLFRRFLVDALKPAAQPLALDARPSIVLMLGVNGAGKTTTAAKLGDAVKAALARQADVLIVDTAGRLHTKTNLMDELAKLKRVIERQCPGGPHESLMVLDAPTGQNGFAQAQMFHETIGLSGVCLTKLDGTAKGGIVVRIVRELRLPIKLVGVGERVEDLKAFDAEAFVDALVPPPGAGAAP